MYNCAFYSDHSKDGFLVEVEATKGRRPFNILRFYNHFMMSEEKHKHAKRAGPRLKQ